MEFQKKNNKQEAAFFCVCGNEKKMNRIWDGSNRGGDSFIHTEPEVQNTVTWKLCVSSWRKVSNRVEG
jgi:hypothetical protein